MSWFAVLEPTGRALVPIFVVSTMIGVGLQLKIGALLDALRNRRWLIGALLANFVALPCAALLAGHLFSLALPLSIALLLVSTVPGSPAPVKFNSIAGGENAKAVSLVIVLMLVSIFSQPIMLPALIEGVQVSYLAIAKTLTMSVLLPVLLGVLIGKAFVHQSTKLHPFLNRISNISSVLILIIFPILYWESLMEYLNVNSIVAIFFFSSLCLSVGWLFGGPEFTDRKLLSLSCCQGNLAAAFVVAVDNLKDPSIVISMLMIMIVSVLYLIVLSLIFSNSTYSK